MRVSGYPGVLPEYEGTRVSIRVSGYLGPSINKNNQFGTPGIPEFMPNYERPHPSIEKWVGVPGAHADV